MMKAKKINEFKIIIEKVDINLICEITGINNLKKEEFKEGFQIKGGNLNILNIEIDWSNYLLEILEDRKDINFVKEVFLRRLEESTYSNYLVKIEEALDDIERVSPIRKRRRLKKFIEENKVLINELKPAIKCSLESDSKIYLTDPLKGISYEEFIKVKEDAPFKIKEIINMELGNIEVIFDDKLFLSEGIIFEYNNFSDIKKMMINKNILKPIEEIKELNFQVKKEEPINKFEKNNLKLTKGFSISEDMEIFEKIKNKLIIKNPILSKYFPELEDFFSEDNDYVENWQEISTQLKAKNEWTCEECGYQAKDNNDKKNIHTHHINGNKKDNSNENLKVLCVNCHSKKEGLGHRLISWK